MARSESDSAVRIVDLAAELGLSVATVSRALSHNPAVRPEVAQRVRDHATERGYVANRLARSLRSQSRSFVGFLVPDVHNLAYSIAASATAQHVARSGNQLILAISGDDPDQELQAIRSLAEAQVGGLIVAPSADVADASRRLLRTMTVVEFNRSAGLSSEMVLCDERAAFAEATRHLVELGHRSIGYIGSTDRLSNGRERLEGIRAELERVGLVLRDEHTRLLPPTEQAGAEAAHEILTAPDRPTGLVVGGSNLSQGTAHTIRRLGLTLPDDLSLVVYGDSDWGELFTPTLTTIKAPYLEMARVVTDAVSGLMGAEQVRGGEVRLPAELVVRESTAPPRTQP
jgi:LacI family transcriptional regulator